MISPPDSPTLRPPAPGRRVLVVEDDRALREIIVTILQIKGFEVAAAATVAQALGSLAERSPDYLILDLNLPDGNGITVLEEIRRRALPTKVAVASGSLDRALVARTRELGVEEIVRKPYRASDLTRWLRQWIGSAEGAEAPPDLAAARPGFSLIEAVIATVIVAVMLCAALQTVAAARASDYTVTNRARGQFLAQALLSEVLEQSYSDPLATPLFGPEVGETRPTFDDVDDYSNNAELTPQDKSGNALPNTTGWTRSVVVEWVAIDNLNGPASLTETGIKRVTVTASYKGAPAATLTGFATQAP